MTTSPIAAGIGLEALNLGDHSPAVPRLRSYLQHYGYLPLQISEQVTDLSVFDDEIERGLRSLQLSFGLESSGQLDAQTIEILGRPRCPLPDVVWHTWGHAETPWVAWNHQPVTYALHNYCENVGPAITVEIVEGALATWAAACSLTFQLSPIETADLKFWWCGGDHGDGGLTLSFPLAPGKVPGHAFYPPPAGSALSGRIHLNRAEAWSISDPSTGSADLLTILVHEIGHALGIQGHFNANSLAVMNGTFSWGLVRRVLQPSDVAAIRRLYP